MCHTATLGDRLCQSVSHSNLGYPESMCVALFQCVSVCHRLSIVCLCVRVCHRLSMVCLCVRVCHRLSMVCQSVSRCGASERLVLLYTNVLCDLDTQTRTQSHIHTYTQTHTHKHIHNYTQTHNHIYIYKHWHMYKHVSCMLPLTTTQ